MLSARVWQLLMCRMCDACAVGCGYFPRLCHGDSDVAGVKGEVSDGRKLRHSSSSQANS